MPTTSIPHSPPATAVEYVASPRLVDLLPDYERYLIGESRRAQGIERYLHAMRRLIGSLGDDTTMADLTRPNVQRYKEELGARCAASTVNNMLTVVRDFAIWAVNAGLRTDDPTVGIKRAPKRRPSPNPLYADEIATLLKAIEAPPPQGSRAYWYWRRNRLCVLIFLYTGLRLSEVARLTWSHVNLRAGVIKVFDGKGGKDRIVPIHPCLASELEAVPADTRLPGRPIIGHVRAQPLTSKGLAKIFRTWLPKQLDTLAGDEVFHIYAHRLRHTFASHLVWNDVDLWTLQELLGHSQLSTTEHYVATDERRKRAGIAKLPDFGQGDAS